MVSFGFVGIEVIWFLVSGLRVFRILVCFIGVGLEGGGDFS